MFAAPLSEPAERRHACCSPRSCSPSSSTSRSRCRSGSCSRLPVHAPHREPVERYALRRRACCRRRASRRRRARSASRKCPTASRCSRSTGCCFFGAASKFRDALRQVETQAARADPAHARRARDRRDRDSRARGHPRQGARRRHALCCSRAFVRSRATPSFARGWSRGSVTATSARRSKTRSIVRVASSTLPPSMRRPAPEPSVAACVRRGRTPRSRCQPV